MPTANVGYITGDRETLIEAQQGDETLGKCLKALRRMFVSGKNHGSEFIMETQHLYRSYQLSGHKRYNQLVLPKVYHGAVLKLAYEGIMASHQGVQNTTNMVLQEIHWPEIIADVKRFAKSCGTCQRTIPNRQVPRAPLEARQLLIRFFSAHEWTSSDPSNSDPIKITGIF